MDKVIRWTLVALLALGGTLVGGFARAQVDCTACVNDEEGDNESSTGQGGESASGDAVAGQVTGVVSAGETSVDATNRSEDVDVSSGDTSASNEAVTQTGQFGEGETEVFGDPLDITVAQNLQDGDNSTDVVQAAEASSGDGVGGQVIGVVTSAGGSADVVAANTSEDVDVETGDATADNFVSTLTGQIQTDGEFDFGFVEGDGNGSVVAFNVQDGDNETATDQSATPSTGDGVGGQVLGIVSAGASSVDATNSSDDVDIDTGDADAANAAIPLTGQSSVGSDFVFSAGEIDATFAVNNQEGDNENEAAQAADASSGDGVGGQVIGVVTSAGGSADVVAANTSEDVDVETGDAAADNLTVPIAGQLAIDAGFELDAEGDITGTFAVNLQDGDNSTGVDQAATAATGDGVGGQVLGVVSAGDTSVDATNSSEDVDISTGDADAGTVGFPLTGQGALDSGFTLDADIDITGTASVNAQEGDNEDDATQAADASSGDGVGGQVIGAVTSAGGSADVVAANTSEDVDVETGDATADNLLITVTGQRAVGASVGVFSGTDITGEIAFNSQDGDNATDASQASNAATGDGVGGQVLGIVSAGDTSLDATNASDDVDLATGDADTANTFGAFVGQLATDLQVTIEGEEIEGSVFANVQDGDNDKELVQSANAATGDAVGGQVAGVVTSAGGSADLVLANTSEGLDGETGDSDFENFDGEFVGQNVGSALEEGLTPLLGVIEL